MPFTPEELAELAAFDAEIDNDDFISAEDMKRSRQFDTQVRQSRLDNRGKKIAERSKAYREANKAQIADYQKAYYEANKAQIKERRRRHYAESKFGRGQLQKQGSDRVVSAS